MPETESFQPTGPVHGIVRPPGSKSLTNRALICAALADGRTELQGVLDSEDTRVMADCLQKLGVEIEPDWQNHRLIVQGVPSGPPCAEADLFVENSGTSMRFLVPYVSLGKGTYSLDGIARMRERPIKDLLDALTQTGVEATSLHENGCPPVQIETSGIQGGKIHLRGDISSQYLSGLLMVAPYAQQPLDIELEGGLVSIPYVEMTCAVMEAFGTSPSFQTDDSGVPLSYQIPTSYYQARTYEIEPDASAASYFFAASAITQGSVTVTGLSKTSLQGDVEFVAALQQMGCEVTWEADRISVEGRKLHGIEIDMNDISDTVMTLAVVALFAEGPTKITGVGHIRHKETDRISAVVNEIQKLGGQAEGFEDGLIIHPTKLHGAEIHTYNDHRMAMSFALAGLRVPGVIILDPGCTVKTYPNYFEEMRDFLSGSATISP
ncbi:3-phosphoshikimate 1-carboxyvinyltransferase [Planctomycetales bacterium 10988]|nr:3-phosphoshikimate 1-carboxyvinyltransferase [Planctomycetales bacterium 10988]